MSLTDTTMFTGTVAGFRMAGRGLLLLLLLLFLLATSAGASEELMFETSDGQDISLTHFAAEGDYLLLWLAPEYGFRDAHRLLAKQLSAEGVEVWQSDLVESLFMPPGTTSTKQLDGAYVAELIAQAHREPAKQIAVAGDSYAAITALRGAHRWQQESTSETYLVGAVLFSPYGYAYIPPLGSAPEYLPIIDSTNIPMLIIQAEDSASSVQFETLLQKLRLHDSPIYTQVIPDIMSLFYEDPPTEAMAIGAQPLAQSIRQVLPLMAHHGYPPQPVALAQPADSVSGIDIYLKEFRGQNRPGPIHLNDVNGEAFIQTEFIDRVTLVNFWATWCPPCIEEIPSLNRLKSKMAGRPFELISINYAEDRGTVLEFMQSVEVDFPVLLDTNGRLTKDWNVISYPSTFVIDSKGIIRFGVNAAIDWDSPEMIKKLETLMQ